MIYCYNCNRSEEHLNKKQTCKYCLTDDHLIYWADIEKDLAKMIKVEHGFDTVVDVADTPQGEPLILRAWDIKIRDIVLYEAEAPNKFKSLGEENNYAPFNDSSLSSVRRINSL